MEISQCHSTSVFSIFLKPKVGDDSLLSIFWIKLCNSEKMLLELDPCVLAQQIGLTGREVLLFLVGDRVILPQPVERPNDFLFHADESAALGLLLFVEKSG